MRIMYDSVNPDAIPGGAELVAGYVDGIFGPDHVRFNQPGWDIMQWLRFTTARHVGIAVNPSTNAGIVGDCETGDMTPATLVNWVVMRRAAGVEPTGYVSDSRWSEAKQAFDAARVRQPLWWVAHYDNVAEVPEGAVAKQYANSNLTGNNYDVSIVVDHWPGVDDVPVVGQQFSVNRSDMVVIARKDGTKDIFDAMPDGSGRHIALATNGVVTFDDVLPGSWYSFFGAMWDEAETVLTATGFGWQAGQGGQAWSIKWDAASGAWSQPFNEVGQQS